MKAFGLDIASSSTFQAKVNAAWTPYKLIECCLCSALRRFEAKIGVRE